MKNSISAIPEGYHSITPYLILNNAKRGIEFYKQAFNAVEIMRMEKPDGKIGHAELEIGNSKIMLTDECPEMDARSPAAYGGSPMGIHLYVENVDTIVDQAITAGAKLTKPIENMFYGDRNCKIEDPFGHTWCISTHIEDVSPEEIEKRTAELLKK